MTSPSTDQTTITQTDAQARAERKAVARAAREAGHAIRQSGNAIFDATPVTDWWTHDTLQVLELAFPDYALHALVDRATDQDRGHTSQRARIGRALLRHRSDPDQWLFITGDSMGFLLPLRYSTGGQWFRFKDHSSEFIAGTADEVLTGTFNRYHPDSQRDVCWWLLDQFTTDPDSSPSIHPSIDPAIDPSTYSPTWTAVAPADTRLAAAHGDGTLTADSTTADLLTAAFPNMRLVALLEGDGHRARALLRTTSEPTREPTRWLYLRSWFDTLLKPDTTPPSLRADEGLSAYTRSLYGTAEELLTPERSTAETFKELHGLWWLLHHLGNDLINHPTTPDDRDTGLAYRHEWMAHRTMLLLTEDQKAKEDMARDPEALLTFTRDWD